MKRIILSKIAAGCLVLILAACAPATISPQPAAETPPVPAAATQAADVRTVKSDEFGVSLAYAAGLAESVSIRQVGPAPLNPNTMFAESHPGYVSATFSGYNLKQPYQLAYPLSEPQVMVFHTGDFAAYSTQSGNDFPAQQRKLADLLAGELDAQRCTTPPHSVEDHLPYLPWTNAGQVFCAQLKKLEFGNGSGAEDGGSGIRYITTFAQGIQPVVEGTVFYTFQGLTKDGQGYVSAVFPVRTGIFAADSAQSGMPGLEDMRRELAGQIMALNGRGGEQFSPSLDALDAVIESLVVR